MLTLENLPVSSSGLLNTLDVGAPRADAAVGSVWTGMGLRLPPNTVSQPPRGLDWIGSCSPAGGEAATMDVGSEQGRLDLGLLRLGRLTFQGGIGFGNFHAAGAGEVEIVLTADGKTANREAAFIG